MQLCRTPLPWHGQIQARPSVPQRLKSYSSFSIDPLLDEKALHGRMLSFIRGCMSPEVITALSRLAGSNMLPINCTRPLEGTLAAAFVLCQRANLVPALLATQPELLLSVLWILEQISSQYRSHLSTILRSYLDYARPLPRQKLYPLKWWRKEMLKWQMIVLHKASWRMHIEVERDLAPVLALMDGPGISHRLAALRACVWSDAQLRLAAHSRISRSPSPVISQRPVAAHQLFEVLRGKIICQ
ncbi:hypothetical protein WJX75_005731 [Coccomyxa subellipsoidea]|uniref:Uncharacterized protein n=1 Tax=Coccomyxa subellipsoidea TaxID=248742 RepID=A0ABR2YTX0_9CHLO